ncbi:hypothetical protein NLO95_13710 [Pseudomonas syringae]|nr:hypothetical protein [Pseudomonas syringae]
MRYVDAEVMSYDRKQRLGVVDIRDHHRSGDCEHVDLTSRQCLGQS